MRTAALCLFLAACIAPDVDPLFSEVIEPVTELPEGCNWTVSADYVCPFDLRLAICPPRAERPVGCCSVRAPYCAAPESTDPLSCCP